MHMTWSVCKIGNPNKAGSPTSSIIIRGELWSEFNERCFLFVLQYKMLLYSVDGRCLATYSAYDWALGVKSVAWSPTSQFLAIGSYDQKVCMYVTYSAYNWALGVKSVAWSPTSQFLAIGSYDQKVCMYVTYSAYD